MNFAFTFTSLTGIIVLAALIGMLWMMFRRQSRKPMAAVRKIPPRSLKYEWVTTPLRKAKRNVLEKFPELAALDPAPDGVHLIRFGLFNIGTEPVEADQFTKPFSIRFAEGAEVLSATVAEMLKTKTEISAAPQVTGPAVELPPCHIDGHGTVIFNLIVRGGRDPESIAAEIDGFGPPQRL